MSDFNFELYDFQKECQKIIDETSNNLILESPTGSGKTVIAEFTIQKAIREGKKVIYTSPLKALSNQKYFNFKEKYSETSVGLITGDFTIGRNSNILIMTAEILRNILLGDKEFLKDVSYIILDEFHYMNDDGRGTVWEEILMLVPKEISVVALSATFPNSDEVRDWFEKIHKETSLVRTTYRPVPLKHFYYNNTHLREINEGYKLPICNKEYDLNVFISKLAKSDMLPCIYFAFNRINCNEYARDVHVDLLSSEDKKEVTKIINEFCKEFPSFTHSFLRKTLSRGVGVHHAGILPQVKRLIEDLYLKGYVKVVFATETLAAGINLPARTTILSGLNKYSDVGNRNLTISEFRQMSGRAGRKGFDETGNVVILGKNEYETTDIRDYILADADKIESNINLGYGTFACMIGTLGLDNINKVLDKSFYVFLNQLRKKQNNYCKVYTDSKFEKYLNYSRMQDRYKSKLERGVINLKEYTEKLSNIRQKIKCFKCGRCKELQCHKDHMLNKERDMSTSLKEQINNIVSVLKHYKYIDKNNNLTWAGNLLKEINSENEIFMLELLLTGVFDDLDYSHLVYVLACILTGNKKYDFKVNTKKQVSARESLRKVRKVLTEVKNIEDLYGIENELEINTAFAELVLGWAEGDTWEQLQSKGLLENYEGDFYRIVRRVIDVLRQFHNLSINTYIVSESLNESINLAIAYLDRGIVAEL